MADETLGRHKGPNCFLRATAATKLKLTYAAATASPPLHRTTPHRPLHLHLHLHCCPLPSIAISGAGSNLTPFPSACALHPVAQSTKPVSSRLFAWLQTTEYIRLARPLRRSYWSSPDRQSRPRTLRTGHWPAPLALLANINHHHQFRPPYSSSSLKPTRRHGRVTKRPDAVVSDGCVDGCQRHHRRVCPPVPEPLGSPGLS